MEIEKPSSVDNAYDLTPEADTLIEERHRFENREVVSFTPAKVRLDLGTSEEASPLVYVQGINGDPKALLIAKTLAEKDERKVIVVIYSDLEGTAQPITAEHPHYREDATIPEVDAIQADDIIGALDTLDITGPVDLAGESRGGIRAVAAVEKHPDRFRNVYLKDPAAQDGRTFGEAHRDALRLVIHQKARKLMGRGALKLVGGDLPGTRQSPRALRIEQKSVAAAQMDTVLAKIPENVMVTIGSDVQDKAFRTPNVRATMQRTGADQLSHIRLVETDTGGHGIGLNKEAIDVAIQGLHEMELARAA